MKRIFNSISMISLLWWFLQGCLLIYLYPFGKIYTIIGILLIVISLLIGFIQNIIIKRSLWVILIIYSLTAIFIITLAWLFTIKIKDDILKSVIIFSIAIINLLMALLPLRVNNQS